MMGKALGDAFKGAVQVFFIMAGTIVVLLGVIAWLILR